MGIGVGVGVGVGLWFAHLEGEAERRDIGEIHGRYRGDIGEIQGRNRGATSKVRPSGERADLKTVACCGTMPATRMVGSRGSMSERCSVRREESAPRGGSSIARRRAIRFGRDSPLALRA